jgi:hypothetical protein
MSDDATIGDRVDQAIADAKAAVDDLVSQLQPKLQELGTQVSAAVDAVQAKIDEVQAAWDARE